MSILRKLLKKTLGHNPTPLFNAIANSDLDLVRRLLNSGYDPNDRSTNESPSLAKGSTAMHFLIFTKVDVIEEMLRLLTKQGAVLDARDNLGFTVLHRVALNGYERAVLALLAARADPNSRDQSGVTPLHMWARGRIPESRCKSILNALISHGANIDAEDIDGHSPLHDAIHNSNRRAYELLVAKGANVNSNTKTHFTPLHLAAAQDATTAARTLLEAGANPALCDSKGLTPIDYARRNRHPVMVRLLTNFHHSVDPTAKLQSMTRNTSHETPDQQVQSDLIREGQGFGNIIIMESTAADVIELNGNRYEIIEHKPNPGVVIDYFTVEIQFKEKGLSFYYQSKDTEKVIVGMAFYPPFLGRTAKGISLNKNIMLDVFEKYGQAQWLTTSGGSTWFCEYDGIKFHVEKDPTLSTFNEEVCLKKPIVRISI